MNTILTLLIYLAIGSILVFIVGVSIQMIQSRENRNDKDLSERKRRGEKHNEQSES